MTFTENLVSYWAAKVSKAEKRVRKELLHELSELADSESNSASIGSERSRPGQEKVSPAMFRKTLCACELCEEVRRKVEQLDPTKDLAPSSTKEGDSSAK